jgi:hypothetical protein
MGLHKWTSTRGRPGAPVRAAENSAGAFLGLACPSEFLVRLNRSAVAETVYGARTEKKRSRWRSKGGLKTSRRRRFCTSNIAHTNMTTLAEMSLVAVSLARSLCGSG